VSKASLPTASSLCQGDDRRQMSWGEAGHGDGMLSLGAPAVSLEQLAGVWSPQSPSWAGEDLLDGSRK
jgi:hypothetical protein